MSTRYPSYTPYVTTRETPTIRGHMSSIRLTLESAASPPTPAPDPTGGVFFLTEKGIAIRHDSGVIELGMGFDSPPNPGDVLTFDSGTWVPQAPSSGSSETWPFTVGPSPQFPFQDINNAIAAADASPLPTVVYVYPQPGPYPQINTTVDCAIIGVGDRDLIEVAGMVGSIGNVLVKNIRFIATVNMSLLNLRLTDVTLEQPCAITSGNLTAKRVRSLVSFTDPFSVQGTMILDEIDIPGSNNTITFTAEGTPVSYEGISGHLIAIRVRMRNLSSFTLGNPATDFSAHFEDVYATSLVSQAESPFEVILTVTNCRLDNQISLLDDGVTEIEIDNLSFGGTSDMLRVNANVPSTPASEVRYWNIQYPSTYSPPGSSVLGISDNFSTSVLKQSIP